MTWVTSGVTWETTRAPTLLTNFFTIICWQQRHISLFILKLTKFKKQTNWLIVWKVTCSFGPNPDDTSTSLALHASFGGLLFSLSSCPSDRELLSFWVLAAEVEEGVLETPVPLTPTPLCADFCAAGEKKHRTHSHLTRPIPLSPLLVILHQRLTLSTTVRLNQTDSKKLQ